MEDAGLVFVGEAGEGYFSATMYQSVKYAL